MQIHPLAQHLRWESNVKNIAADVILLNKISKFFGSASSVGRRGQTADTARRYIKLQDELKA